MNNYGIGFADGFYKTFFVFIILNPSVADGRHYYSLFVIQYSLFIPTVSPSFFR